MGKTGIPYLDLTANVTVGCSGQGCAVPKCWARRLHEARRKALLAGAKLPEQYRAPFEQVQLFPERVREVMRLKNPAVVGWSFTSDPFDPQVPDQFLDECLAVMALSPHLTHIVLTKQAVRLRKYLENHPQPNGMYAEYERNGKTTRIYSRVQWPLPNVWAGVSVCGPADRHRIRDLLATPAAHRWVSLEPLLAPVDLRGDLTHCPEHDWEGGFCFGPCSSRRRIAAVVVGCEKPLPRDAPRCEVCGGKGDDCGVPAVGVAWHEPCDACQGTGYAFYAWARQVRDACAAAGTAFCLKQGPSERGRVVEFPELDGVRHTDVPWRTPSTTPA